MNRRQFISVGGAALIASQLAGTAVPIAVGEENKTKADYPEAAYDDGTEDGNGPLNVRFLGTGAADWDGKDERGEQRRLSWTRISRCH